MTGRCTLFSSIQKPFLNLFVSYGVVGCNHVSHDPIQNIVDDGHCQNNHERWRIRWAFTATVLSRPMGVA